jgi:ribosomal protein L24
MTSRRPTDPGPMETANGVLRVGDLVRVIGGPNRGQRGHVTHLYTRGVFAGLVVIDNTTAVEGVNVQGDRPEGDAA